VSTFAAALRLLDQIQRLPQLEGFDPALFAGAVREKLAIELAPEELTALVEAIERFTQKAMGIRLTNAPEAVPTQLRSLLVATISAYDQERELLRRRVEAMLSRFAGAQALTDWVAREADRVLATRAALLQIVREAREALAKLQAPPEEKPEEPGDPVSNRFSMIDFD